MKADYGNWVPDGMVTWSIRATLLSAVLFILFGATPLILNGTPRLICAIVLGLLTLVLLVTTVWLAVIHGIFSYGGKRKLSKTVIEGVAAYVDIPEGGTCLDVGCGSGALSIACAKRNPKARVTGCDIWSGPYRNEYTKERCERNAEAEGAANVTFTEGNAVSLPFADGTFDAVTSNYVYHNIAGRDKQELLLETLRVLKKGGTFAIHDIMTKARYGDMDAFIKKLKDEGYSDVRMIGTADGMFMKKKEAVWLDLGGSALLTGRK